MDQNNERPVILAIVTIFLTFTLVYLIFFRQLDSSSTLPSDSDQLPLTGIVTNSSDELLSTMISGIVVTGATLPTSWSDGWVDLSAWTSVAVSWSSSRPLSTWSSVWGSNPSSDTVMILKDTLSSLSGVTLRYNSIKMSEILSLPVKIAFTDTWRIQYAYLGTGDAESVIKWTVKRLWWNIVAIETENDIKNNNLRWDRFLFVNVPIPQVTFVRSNAGVETKLLVTMIVEIGEDRWLIQAPYAVYHTSKSRMKTIFEQIYGTFL